MTIHERLSKHILTDPASHVVDLDKSHGSWFVDEHGREYLDCFSQFASQPLGWNHPKIEERKERLHRASIHKLANSDVYCEDYAEFVEKFASITPDFKHLFFIDGGALAVENALKAAFDYKCQKLPHLNPNHLNVIHLEEAFHGRSGYTLSLMDKYNRQKIKKFPSFCWDDVTNPHTSNDYVGDVEKESLEDIYETLHSTNTAAIIIEPIQGEGGDNHFRKEYFQELRKLADEHDVMLIFDEVQTGMGLTGEWWCYEHFGVVPDMLVFGKKSQVCGFAATEKIDEVKNNVFVEPSRINSTFGGNLVDMVRCSMYIDVIREDKLIENADKVGWMFLRMLTGLGLKNPRGLGLMNAFDMDTTEDRDKLLTILGEKMLCLPCGKKSIRFRPHLTFGCDDVITAREILANALKHFSGE
jgi:L-lysine 6-transaminase